MALSNPCSPVLLLSATQASWGSFHRPGRPCRLKGLPPVFSLPGGACHRHAADTCWGAGSKGRQARPSAPTSAWAAETSADRESTYTRAGKPASRPSRPLLPVMTVHVVFVCVLFCLFVGLEGFFWDSRHSVLFRIISRCAAQRSPRSSRPTRHQPWSLQYG